MSARVHPMPLVRVQVDGADVAAIAERLNALTLTDNRGLEVDQLEITLDDADGALAFPRRGAKLALWIGWSAEAMVDKGLYIVNGIEHAGTPDKLTIRADSADLKQAVTQKKEASYHGKTLGDIARHVAADHGLEPVISNELANEEIEHVDQTAESDANLLTRLAELFDAIVTVKAGKLLVFRAGEAQSATGKALPQVEIVRAVGDSHRFSIADRDNYSETEAFYEDKGAARRGSVTVEADPSGSPLPQEPNGTKILRHVYANKKNAERAAKAANRKQQRGVAEFSITLALGRPELFPELPASVKGFKPEIDSTAWIITRVTHTITADAGYTMGLELELKIS